MGAAVTLDAVKISEEEKLVIVWEEIEKLPQDIVS